MAHREMRRSRVLVAAAGLVVALAALWLRVAWLQLARHGYYEQRAELNQEQRVLVRPSRGDLLDRQGRPLARDLLTYSISAAPREMKDERGTARALARLLRRDPGQLAREFARRPRFLWVARRVPPDLGQQVAALEARGVYLSIETQREYLLGPAAAEILGRTDLDNQGVEGLELEYDEELRGRSGWTTLFRDGHGGAHALPRGLKRSPQDGNEVVLTLDADLQSIVESHLARQVDSLHAERGFALFLDPRNGEVLAAASAPHLPPGRARNWPFTDQFEPGSTYKLVVAGAALEEGVARPDQVFEAAANGVCQVAPGAVFHDVHHQARYTFRDAVRWSSNIVMGKLGLLVGPERLFQYSTALGFGSVTGVEFPGEAAGKLRTPNEWSARSCPTIAIGHELSVTPLQLALAYGTVANGGVLMEPSLVREVRDPRGRVARREPPRAVRRVFGENTTRLMREMLCAVVDSGTAKAARVPGLRIAGKTGTAQKYDAAVGTYGRGKYVSSFVGFAPADAPRLVGVVVIDEPHSRHYYGGEIAAPVFREILLDLMRLPHGPLEPGGARVAERPPAPAPVIVPDLCLLPPRVAEARAAAFGLHARFQGDGPRVLAQAPAAGQAVERGAAVEAYLAPPADSLGRFLPDLTGLPVREALRRLTLRQVPARIQGFGAVVRQDPPAGTRLPLAGACRLWCAPGVLPAARPAEDQDHGRIAVATAGASPGGRPEARNSEP